MKKHYNEDDYRFAAAKISALEALLPTEADIKSLCGTGTLQSFSERVNTYGIDIKDGNTEAGLSAFLAGIYGVLSSFLPDSGICALMQARFDCHNIKTALKCAVAGIDPSPFFIDCGTISTSDIAAMADKRDFKSLPELLCKAATAADDVLRANGMARAADTILDRACFEYMQKTAAGICSSEINALLSLKADITNMQTRLRIMKIRNAETARALTSDSYVPGGHIPPYKFIKAETASECAEILGKSLSGARQEKLSVLCAGSAGNDAIAAFLDSAFFSECEDLTRGELLGIKPVIRYIIRAEYAVKNIRIIAAGISAGKDSAELEEEVRSYV